MCMQDLTGGNVLLASAPDSPIGAHALGAGANQEAQDAEAPADEQDGAVEPNRKKTKIAKAKPATKKTSGRAARKRMLSAKALEGYCASSE